MMSETSIALEPHAGMAGAHANVGGGAGEPATRPEGIRVYVYRFGGASDPTST